MPTRPVTACLCPPWIRRSSRPSRPGPILQANMAVVREKNGIACLTALMPQSHGLSTSMSVKGKNVGRRDHDPTFNLVHGNISASGQESCLPRAAGFLRCTLEDRAFDRLRASRRPQSERTLDGLPARPRSPERVRFVWLVCAGGKIVFLATSVTVSRTPTCERKDVCAPKRKRCAQPA